SSSCRTSGALTFRWHPWRRRSGDPRRQRHRGLDRRRRRAAREIPGTTPCTRRTPSASTGRRASAWSFLPTMVRERTKKPDASPKHVRPRTPSHDGFLPPFTIQTASLSTKNSLFHAARFGTDEFFRQATHDNLTGLVNCALFLDRLRHGIVKA